MRSIIKLLLDIIKKFCINIFLLSFVSYILYKVDFISSRPDSIVLSCWAIGLTVFEYVYKWSKHE